MSANVIRKPGNKKMERLRLGATQYQVAQLSGISPGRLSLAERGFVMLHPDEEDRRRDALKQLAAREAATA